MDLEKVWENMYRKEKEDEMKKLILASWLKDATEAEQLLSKKNLYWALHTFSWPC